MSLPSLCALLSCGVVASDFGVADLEHTAILGNTIDAIAAEKVQFRTPRSDLTAHLTPIPLPLQAGIIKRERPVVVGPHVPLHVVNRVCMRCVASNCL